MKKWLEEIANDAQEDDLTFKIKNTLLDFAGLYSCEEIKTYGSPVAKNSLVKVGDTLEFAKTQLPKPIFETENCVYWIDTVAKNSLIYNKATNQWILSEFI